MSAQERIWAWRWDLPYPSKHQGRREWGNLIIPTEQKVTEYVRSDLHDATKAQLTMAVEALRKIADQPDYRLPKPQDIARAVLAEITGEKS